MKFKVILRKVKNFSYTVIKVILRKDKNSSLSIFPVNEFNLHKKQWEKLGSDEPYWSVCTINGKYVKKKFTKENEIEFYNSGKNVIEALHKICKKAGIQYEKGSCLEYGCGVGRVTLQLAKEFSYVVGVDISKNHIQIAKKKKDELCIKNVDFLLLERGVEDMMTIQTFDLIFSIIFLQHIRKKEVFEIFSTFIKIIKKGSLIIFQIPTYHPDYNFETQGNYNKNVLMEMHAVQEKEIISFFSENECKLVNSYDANLCGEKWIDKYFIFKKL